MIDFCKHGTNHCTWCGLDASYSPLAMGKNVSDAIREAREAMTAALMDCLGSPYQIPQPRIGTEFAPGAVITGPKRIPRKLKKADKKKGIMRFSVSIQPFLPSHIICTIGFVNTELK